MARQPEIHKITPEDVMKHQRQYVYGDIGVASASGLVDEKLAFMQDGDTLMVPTTALKGYAERRARATGKGGIIVKWIED